MAEQVTSRQVAAIAYDITSSVGMGSDAHWQAAVEGKTGIRKYNERNYSSDTFYGSMLSDQQLAVIDDSNANTQDLTSFEKLSVYSVRQAISVLTSDIDYSQTCLILSTTKGNIEALEEIHDERTLLNRSAQRIADTLGIVHKPVVVSHACISGSVALLYAHRLISNNRYKNVIVVGCDRFTPFVLNGFQSFQAIADGPCRPFDAGRTGINLGEAAATIVLSAGDENKPLAHMLGGATSNDANHISGPSRTGEELADAIKRAMSEAGVAAKDIDMISAHGTATAYNDEMEAKALNLSGLSEVPVHSMKSYTGHTLGAAGVLESAMVLEAMKHQQLIPSLGYEKHGVPVPLNVTTKMQDADISYVLKTASGFGGSNAAIIWGR